MIHRLKHEKIQWCIDFYPFFSNATLLKIFNNLLAWSLHYSLLSKLSIVVVASKNDDEERQEQISINLTYNISESESRVFWNWPSDLKIRREKINIRFLLLLKGDSQYTSNTHCLKITQNVVFEYLNFGIFPPMFVLLKLTCLVALFDRKLQVFKNSSKWTNFSIFN